MAKLELRHRKWRKKQAIKKAQKKVQQLKKELEELEKETISKIEQRKLKHIIENNSTIIQGE